MCIKQMINQEEKKPIEDSSYFELYRFADYKDYLLMLCGSIAAAGNGAAIPLFAVLWGNVSDAIAKLNPIDAVRPIFYNFIILAFATFAASWIMMACWMIAGERQGIKCRKAYLWALLRQEIGWFDQIHANQLATKVSEQSSQLQKAIGQKMATFIMTLSTTVTGFIVAFAKGWKLSIVITASMPVLAFASFVFTKILQNINQNNIQNYTKAGGKAEETFSSIKTVKSLCGQNFQVSKYGGLIKEAAQRSIKFGMWAGVAMGFMFMTIFLSYALGFWYGGKLIVDKELNDNTGVIYTGGQVLIIFFSIVMGGMSIGQASPCLKDFAQGKTAIGKIKAVLDRESKEVNKTDGIKKSQISGDIKIENVRFAYPSRPDNQILKRVSFEIVQNKRNAIVGESGSGKSTIMQLLLRFYEPGEGRVLLGDTDLKDYDLIWLRKNVGYVGQEPVLFATSIRQNIKYGKHDATDKEIWQALKQAEASDFVKNLQKGLDTYIGVGGSQFSGGQKQRLAIARALIKNPRILLLDEATSALDRKNQRLIQSTLDKVAFGRTTITIAHRLSTVRNCENIIVMDRGTVVQIGNFQDLMKLQGKFYALAKNQIHKQEDAPKARRKESAQDNGDEIQQEELDSNQKDQSKNIENEDQQKISQEKMLLDKYQKDILSRLLSYNKREWYFIILSFTSAIINGTLFPLFSLFLSQMIAILVSPTPSQTKINELALYFVLLSIAAFLVNFGQFSFFNIISQRMTVRLRQEAFQRLVKAPIPFFEDPKNSAGSLSARLSEDCTKVNKLASNFIAMNVQNFASLLTGIIIAFVWSWQLSLVALGMMPFMILSGVVQMKFIQGFSGEMSDAYKQSSLMVMQVVNGIRTVKSFAQQDRVKALYEEKMRQPFQVIVKKGNLSGILFGFSQMIMFLVFGVIFFVGAVFIDRKFIVSDTFATAVERMFVSLFAIMFAAMGTGNNAQFMPDLAQGNLSACRIFKVLDMQSEQMQELQFDQDEDNGDLGNSFVNLKDISSLATEVEIQFRNVSFKYPQRDAYVYRNLSFVINNKQKVALVGPSGCGKSTVVQLLLGFYKIDEGEILINGVNLENMPVHRIRAMFGLVSQEPVLFNGTIKQNVVYNAFQPQAALVWDAIKKANAEKFVNESSEKLQRQVGNKGNLLSGGQKQRIAIARAIIRDPAVFMFDQATSALDNQSEALVQRAINEQIKEKTSITIAHRLETIRNSDKIMVFEQGKIMQEGKYEELMNNKSFFYRLAKGESK